MQQPKAKAEMSVVISLSLPVLKLITSEYYLWKGKYIYLCAFNQTINSFCGH